jgi:tetratricopeptide (TPR) repeat protein
MEMDRTSKSERFVAVVIGNDQARATVSAAIESIPHSLKVVQFKHPDQLLAFHKFSKIDWIYTECFRDESFTAIKMIREIRSGQKNRTVNVSIFINRPIDNDIIPEAFDLGVLSFHAARFSNIEVLSELGELHKLLATYKNLSPLVAAHYLRIYFNEIGDYQQRFEMEKRLLELYKFHPEVLLSLAEVEFVLGHSSAAIKHLRHAVASSPVYNDRVQLMRDKFLSPSESAALDQVTPDQPLFPFKNVVLVESDSAVVQVVKQTLERSGILDFRNFQTAEAALDHLKETESIDLLLTEWRLPGEVSGSGLIQRVRKMGFGHLKIAVLSSLLKKSDELLLEEIGVDSVIGKPLTQKALMELLVELSTADKRPKQSRNLLRKINALLTSNHVAEAEPHVIEFLNLDEPEEVQKQEVIASWLLANGNYAEAIDKAVQVMESGRVTAGIMIVMGRALLKLKDYTNSILFFERAQIASPDGIERLLELAEAKVSINDLDGAAAEINKALKLDPENEWVIMAECSISLEQGEVKKAKGLLAKMSSGKEMASLMNNRAVALAQMGKIEDGIALYNKTIDAMPPNWKTEIARVTYNLGLSYVRSGSYAKAVEVFETVAASKNPVSQKAKDISAKCSNAIAQGKKLAFHPVEDVVLEQSKKVTKKVNVSRLIAKAELKPGDVGLMGIYKASQPRNKNNDEHAGGIFPAKVS